jgi:hypothetical protein
VNRSNTPLVLDPLSNKRKKYVLKEPFERGTARSAGRRAYWGNRWGHMENEEYAAVFEDIAALLRKKKENIFKIRAYEKIARSIRELKEPVEMIVKENRIDTIPGAGEAITKKLQEMTATGKLQFYEKLKSENTPESGL